MSLNHHGGTTGEPSPEALRLLKKIEDQMEGRMKREYPEGRIGPDDDGELVFMMASDHNRGLVVVNFTKPLQWIAMGPGKTREFAQALLARAREVELTEHSRMTPA